MGSTSVRIVRGDANGLISMEKDGVKKDIATVATDGTFSKVGDDDPKNSLRIDESGNLVVDGRPTPGLRVGEDGTLYRGSFESRAVRSSTSKATS